MCKCSDVVRQFRVKFKLTKNDQILKILELPPVCFSPLYDMTRANDPIVFTRVILCFIIYL